MELPTGSVVELKVFGEFWQVTLNGSVLVCAIERRGAINAAAALLRQHLQNSATLAGLRFVGMERAELLAAGPISLGPKGPEIELDLFHRAEAYLQLEMIPSNEDAVVNAYRSALLDENFDQALDCLVQLGMQQCCTNPYWRVLEQLADVIWRTDYLVDRRAKGQLEAKINGIKQRARGNLA